MPTIKITCEGGKTTIETKGFKGKQCMRETADLKKALGIVESETLTAEGRLPEPATRTQQQTVRR